VNPELDLQTPPMNAPDLLPQAREVARLVHAPRTASHLGPERLLREYQAFEAARRQSREAARRILDDDVEA
jgi:hypothetical protein